jgi:uncharacterized protein (DUF983 family)
MDSIPSLTAQPTVVWQPDRAAKTPAWPVPSFGTALLRGLMCTCPACGKTKIFRGYLRVSDDCTECGAPLSRIRADDVPPYFTIFVVAHIVVPLMLVVDRAYHLSDLTQAAIWLPVTTVLCLALLRPIKGATVGLMLRLELVREPQDA